MRKSSSVGTPTPGLAPLPRVYITPHSKLFHGKINNRSYDPARFEKRAGKKRQETKKGSFGPIAFRGTGARFSIPLISPTLYYCY